MRKDVYRFSEFTSSGHCEYIFDRPACPRNALRGFFGTNHSTYFFPVSIDVGYKIARDLLDPRRVQKDGSDYIKYYGKIFEEAGRIVRPQCVGEFIALRACCTSSIASLAKKEIAQDAFLQQWGDIGRKLAQIKKGQI